MRMVHMDSVVVHYGPKGHKRNPWVQSKSKPSPTLSNLDEAWTRWPIDPHTPPISDIGPYDVMLMQTWHVACPWYDLCHLNDF
jgi:hypothetical protein